MSENDDSISMNTKKCPWGFCEPDRECLHEEPKRGSVVIVERQGNQDERRAYYFGKVEQGRYGILAAVDYFDGTGFMSLVHPSRIGPILMTPEQVSLEMFKKNAKS